MIKKGKYLTENLLAKELKTIFPDNIFIQNKPIKEIHPRYRPDFHCKELKLIIEFDGDRHYTDPKRIITDKIKDTLYSQNGWKIVKIPYFVQLSTEVIKDLFGIDIDFKQYFSHGFITTPTFPSYFCELGIEKFKKDLERFSYIKNDIVKSLQDRIEELKIIDLVLPSTLHCLILKLSE